MQAGGLNLEEFFEKTEEECAQLCLNDKGCKAFDSSKPDMFQSGDCFLSYDTVRCNTDTTPPRQLPPRLAFLGPPSAATPTPKQL